MGEPDGASKDVQPQQRGLWLVVLEDKLVDRRFEIGLRDEVGIGAAVVPCDAGGGCDV